MKYMTGHILLMTPPIANVTLIRGIAFGKQAIETRYKITLRVTSTFSAMYILCAVDTAAEDIEPFLYKNGCCMR